MGEVVSLRKSYEAKSFGVAWEGKEIIIAGTLCGHVEMHIPGTGSFVFNPDEVMILSASLMLSREDVLENSRPFDDPLLAKDNRHDR